MVIRDVDSITCDEQFDRRGYLNHSVYPYIQGILCMAFLCAFIYALCDEKVSPVLALSVDSLRCEDRRDFLCCF